jgi:hypothetical protein
LITRDIRAFLDEQIEKGRHLHGLEEGNDIAVVRE